MDERIVRLSKLAEEGCIIDPELYAKYEVKRGLRDVSGRGVLVGLTDISEVRSHIIQDEDYVPCRGKLFYRGYDIEDIVNGFLSEKRFGFEETAYLLLFGSLPSEQELDDFKELLNSFRKLPTDGFVRDIIMHAPGKDMMNALARGVLSLYAFDDNADDTSIPNVLRQCLQLIAQLPLLSVYCYQVFSHYHDSKSLFIHAPIQELSTAENILHLLREDSKYTALEAHILDLCLVLHAEHGGGNNSTFTTHVVTSSGTDTYSSMVSSIGSLKGPLHGGANIKVIQMFEDMMANITDINDDDQVTEYLKKLLNKEAFDKQGLIYGMGHAVYSLSDPRADILKGYVEKLAVEKGLADEYCLYSKVAKLAPAVISRTRRIYKGVSPNIDFYSGFVYKMLGLPMELYTPVFAIARVVGWSIHRIEELAGKGKIIRPAYKSVCRSQQYVPMGDR